MRDGKVEIRVDTKAEAPPLSLPRDVERVARRVARTELPVLITGQTGTGKSLLASRIHEWSQRVGRPFVPVDCAGLPPGVFESELFGDRKGSFTGASEGRQGLVRSADGGTLFLDEISVLPPELQAKLLTLFQEGTLRPIGSDRSMGVDVRIISATNDNLPEMVETGAFRRDLYYRCSRQVAHLPSLRERADEWPAIVRRAAYDVLTSAFPLEEGREATLTAGAVRLLGRQPLLGHFRDLQNTLISAIFLAEDDGGPVRAEHIESGIALRFPEGRAPRSGPSRWDRSRYVAPSNSAEERAAILEALRRLRSFLTRCTSST